VAYIPQNLGLVRRRTALQNTLVGALGRTAGLRALLDWFPKQTVAEARLLLAEVGLDHKRAEPVACLSGGERQRVAIARALLMRPQLILADEFVSQLDAVTAQQILELMRRQADSGVGFLVTTHDPELVAKYADQVMVLRAGRVVYNAAADEAPPAALLKLLET
jgi:ABC-type phosphate/phosphonate transport system ATPase subunit